MPYTTCCRYRVVPPDVGRVAQSVQRLTTGWTVRDRIPVGTRFYARPDRPWGPPSLLYNGYRVFPGGKVRPGRAANPSSAAVMEECDYTSTHPLGHTGSVTGKLSDNEQLIIEIN